MSDKPAAHGEGREQSGGRAVLPRTSRRLPGVVVVMAATVLLALAIRLFVLTACHISSSSMTATLLPGDRVLVNRMAFLFGSPRRGDVVVFHKGDRLVVKRCTAVPGDSVGLATGDGSANAPVQRFRLPGKGDILELKSIPSSAWIPIVHADGGAGGMGPGGVPVINGKEAETYRVTHDLYFMTGDNANASYDSRHYGPVTSVAIVGKVVVIFWSTEAADNATIRWSRVGACVQ